MLLFMESFATWVNPADAVLAPGPGKWTAFVQNPPTNVIFSNGVLNPRFGSQPSLNFQINANGDGYMQKALAKPLSTVTMGFWFYPAVLDVNENVTIAQWLTSGNPQVTLLLTPDLRIALRLGDPLGPVIAQTAASSVVVGTWQFIELRVTFNAVTGFVQINLGSASVVASPVNTDPGGSGAADELNLGVRASGLTMPSAYQIGELYITNDAQPYNVGLLGPIAVIGLLPTADGTTDDFITFPNTLINWQADSAVPASLDAAYVADNTVGDLDLYTGTMPLVPTMVLAVQQSSIARRAVATGVPAPSIRSISNVLRSGEIESDQDGVDVLDTYAWFLNIQEFDPNTGQPFTPAAIAAVQFGVKVVF